MRCCIETVGDLYPDGPAAIAAEGQAFRCKYATRPDHGHMIFRGGAWEWDREAGQLAEATAKTGG